MHRFSEVIEHFQGITGLANALGVSTQAISQWDETFPEGRAYQVEVLTNGRFKADKLPKKGAARRKKRAS